MAQRTPEQYLDLPYTIEIFYDDSDGEPGWVARVVEMPGCITQSETFEGLGKMIRDAMLGWIEIELEDGAEIPEPRPIDDYSGKFVARVPRSLHRDLVKAAERDGVSLNSFVNTTLSRSVANPKVKPRLDEEAMMPHPAWDRLSHTAYRAMIVAGLDIEVEELNEKLLAGWIEKELAQVDAALKSGYFKDALTHLKECRRTLELCGRASPLMATFAQATLLLVEQIELTGQLREGIVEQQQIKARIRRQVQISAQAYRPVREICFTSAALEQRDQEKLIRESGLFEVVQDDD